MLIPNVIASFDASIIEYKAVENIIFSPVLSFIRNKNNSLINYLRKKENIL